MGPSRPKDTDEQSEPKPKKPTTWDAYAKPAPETTKSRKELEKQWDFYGTVKKKTK